METTDYRSQLQEVQDENEALQKSLVDLDKDHEVILSQLIQQRDDLKQQNHSLVEEVAFLRSYLLKTGFCLKS